MNSVIYLFPPSGYSPSHSRSIDFPIISDISTVTTTTTHRDHSADASHRYSCKHPSIKLASK